MISLKELQHQATARAVRKALGATLQSSYDELVSSELPERLRDLIDRWDESQAEPR